MNELRLIRWDPVQLNININKETDKRTAKMEAGMLDKNEMQKVFNSLSLDKQTRDEALKLLQQIQDCPELAVNQKS